MQHGNHRTAMTVAELRSLADNAKALLDANQLGHQTPPWVDYKITRANQRLRDVAFAVAYGQRPKDDNPKQPGYMSRNSLGKIAHNAAWLLEVVSPSTPLMEWQTAYISEAQIDLQDVLDYMVVAGEKADNPALKLKAKGTATKPAGIGCPPGEYLVCPDGIFHGCHCVEGVRHWKWWENRPSPLYPNPAQAQTVPPPITRETHENPWGMTMGRGVTGPLWVDYEARRRYGTRTTPTAGRKIPVHPPRSANPINGGSGPAGWCPQGSVYAGATPAPNNAWTAVCKDPNTGQVVGTFGTARTFPYQHLGFYGYHGS